MNTILRNLLLFIYFPVLLLVGCNNGDDGLLDTPLSAADQASLYIEPKDASLPIGLPLQMQAKITYGNNDEAIDITKDSKLSWRSSDPAIASFEEYSDTKGGDTKGVIIGLKTGVVTITASIEVEGEMVEASTKLTVTNATVTRLFVEPFVKKMPAGLKKQYRAYAEMSDNKILDVTTSPIVIWRSTDSSLATVNNTDSKGFVNTLAKGEVNITAEGTVNNQFFEASSTLEITDAIVTRLFIEPLSKTLPAGMEKQYRAYVEMSDGQIIDATTNPDITWRTSDSSLASIDNTDSKGWIKTLEKGEVTVIAEGIAHNQPFQASSTLVITDAIVKRLFVKPLSNEFVLSAGLSQQYGAYAEMSNGQIHDVTTNPDITWYTSDSSLATVNNADSKGLVKTMEEGEVDIIAKGSVNNQFFEASSALLITDAIVTRLFVEPSSDTLPAGLEKQYRAYAEMSDGYKFDVTTSEIVTWSTSDSTLATVDNANSQGLVKALKEGEVSIIAEKRRANNQVFKASATLNVTPPIPVEIYLKPKDSSLPVGLSLQMQAKVIYSNDEVVNITQSSNWRSSNPTLASFNDTKGLVTALKQGAVTITASIELDGKMVEASTTLTITNTVVVRLFIEPHLEEFTLPVGLDQQYSAFAEMSDGQILDVTTSPSLTWSTTDSTLATVNNTDSKGLVEALKEGKLSVTAEGMANGKLFSAEAELSVIDATITRLFIEPLSGTVPAGLEKQYRAYAEMSDGDILEVTQDTAITWRTSDSSLAVISNVTDSKGLVKTFKKGDVTIFAKGSANNKTIEASATLLVRDPTLEKVTLSAPEISITEYYGVQLQSFGHYSDGTVNDITSLSQWHAGNNLTVVDGLVSASPFIKDFVSKVSVTYNGVDSEETTVFMVEAKRSPVIGWQTPYTDVISSDIYSLLSFQGSAVLDGIYDAKTGTLLAGGYGGGLNPTDQKLYSDNMFVNDVSFIKGIYGTAWPGSWGIPMLQIVEWREGSLSKKIGKLNAGQSISVDVQDRIFAVVVYSSAAKLPRYVSGIQFIYK